MCHFFHTLLWIDLFESAYVFEEAAADLTDVRLLLVEFLLQAFQELPLESIDIFDVAKDGPKLLFSEHVCPLAALFDVTLREACWTDEGLRYSFLNNKEQKS